MVVAMQTLHSGGLGVSPGSAAQQWSELVLTPSVPPFPLLSGEGSPSEL